MRKVNGSTDTILIADFGQSILKYFYLMIIQVQVR